MIEGPYKLPEGWRWVRLGEVCEINPRRPRLHVDPNEPATFVPMTAVEDQTGTIVTPEVRPFEQVRQGYTYFEEGDVLFAKITPCMENGKTAIARGLLNGFGFGSTEFHVLRPSGSVIPEWIWLFIRQERFRKAAKASFRGGVGQQRVPKEFLEHHPIPLPPLDEQRRMVARLEELMSRVREAKRLRQQAKEDAERLMQAALAETFPRPGTEPPPGWRWVRLGEVCETKMGGTPSTKDAEYWEPPEIVWVTPEDLEKCELNRVFSSRRLISRAGLEKSSAKLFPHKTVLLSTTATIGKVGVAEKPLSANQQISGIICGDYVNPEFLAYYLLRLGETGLKQLGGTATATHINQTNLRSLPIPLPPLEEQRRIVAHLEAVQEKAKALKEAQAATDAELQRLEQAILDKAFRGEL